MSDDTKPESAGSTLFDAAGMPTTLSYSQVSTYQTCPRRYYLNYLDPAARGRQSVIGSAIGGSAIHAAIELGDTNEWWRYDAEKALDWLLVAFGREFKTEYDEALERVGAENIYWGGKATTRHPDGETADWWFEVGAPRFLGRYLSIRANDEFIGTKVVLDADGEHPWVEKRISTNLEVDGVTVHISGMVDTLMYVSGDGERIIRDWKTGRMLPEGMQLAAYAWMLEQVGVHARTGEFAWLRGAKPETLLRRYDLTDWVPLIPEQFEQVHRGIQAQYFPFAQNVLCPTCTVKRDCPYGKTLDPVEEG